MKKFLLLIAAVLICWGGYIQWTMSNTYLWPKTEGIILDSIIEKCTKYEGKTGIYDGIAANVRYKYSVNGKEYVLNRVGPEEEFCHRMHPETEAESAKNTVNKYQKGKKITVRYNPRKPQFAIIEHRMVNNGLWLLVVGSVLIAAAFYIDKNLTYKLRK